MADNPNVARVDRYFPIQGSNKWETVNFEMTKAIHVDVSAGTVATHDTFILPKNVIVTGIVCRVHTATAGGTVVATVGSTSTSAHAAGSAAGALQGAIPTEANAYLSSATAVQVTIGTAAMTAGKVDIYVSYIPYPLEDLDPNVHASYTL